MRVRVRVRVRVRFLEISNNVSSQGRSLPQSCSLLRWRGRCVLHDGLSQQSRRPEPHTLDPDWGGFPHPTRVGGGGGGEKEGKMWWLPSPLLSSRPSQAERDSGVLQPMGMADPYVEVGEPRGVVCDSVDGGLRSCGPLICVSKRPLCNGTQLVGRVR